MFNNSVWKEERRCVWNLLSRAIKDLALRSCPIWTAAAKAECDELIYQTQKLAQRWKLGKGSRDMSSETTVAHLFVSRSVMTKTEDEWSCTYMRRCSLIQAGPVKHLTDLLMLIEMTLR